MKKKRSNWTDGSRRTLVLSTSYEIVNFTNEIDAVIMMLKDRAEPIATWSDAHISTSSRKIDVPSVLLLKHPHQRKQRRMRFHRNVVFRRDRWSCQYCGHRLTKSSATIDHVYPVSKGGETSYKNCVAACKRCNHKKAFKTAEEVGMTLMKRPEHPSILHFYNINTNNWHPSWDQFIGHLLEEVS